MTPSDDELTIAFAFIEQPEESEHVKAAFANIGRAPLSTIIDEMLRGTPSIRLKAHLQCIASLNQGCLDDLDSSDFASYIIRKTGLTDSLLNACKRALRSYVKTRDMALSPASTLMAARTEDGSTRTLISPADIARELQRRQ